MVNYAYTYFAWNADREGQMKVLRMMHRGKGVRGLVRNVDEKCVMLQGPKTDFAINQRRRLRQAFLSVVKRHKDSLTFRA